MARYAVTFNGVIENVIEAEEGFKVEGKRLWPDPDWQAQIGGTCRNGVFTPAPQPEKEEPQP